MSEKRKIQLGIAILFLAIALGAFGAHGIKNLVGPEQVASFNTGVRYQFYHGFAILLSVWLAEKWVSQAAATRAVWCFLIGILFFSGSIYLLSLREVIGIENWKFLGPITPIGGVLFMVGWGILLVGVKASTRPAS